jgi:hypothetical protein
MPGAFGQRLVAVESLCIAAFAAKQSDQHENRKGIAGDQQHCRDEPAAMLVKPRDQDLGQPFGQNDGAPGMENMKMSCFGFSLWAVVQRPTTMCQ